MSKSLIVNELALAMLIQEYSNQADDGSYFTDESFYEEELDGEELVFKPEYLAKMDEYSEYLESVIKDDI